jgi:biotin synthase
MVHAAEVKHNDSRESEPVRHDWDRAEAEALYALPFADLMFRAQSIHRSHFDPNHVETASLLSIKTGGCPEDCGYCSQSAHYDTGLKATKLMAQADVAAPAMPAQAASAWPRRGAIRKTAISTRSAAW